MPKPFFLSFNTGALAYTQRRTARQWFVLYGSITSFKMHYLLPTFDKMLSYFTILKLYFS